MKFERKFGEDAQNEYANRWILQRKVGKTHLNWLDLSLIIVIISIALLVRFA